MSDPFAPNSGWGNYALEGLSEISLPAAIELVPQTVGWLFLFVVILYCLGKKMLSATRRYWRNRYRRVAIKQLQAIKQQVEQGNHNQASKIPALLKATALHAFPRKDIAQLFGKDWETFLDASYSGPSFNKNFSGTLYTLSYQPGTADQLTEPFWQQCQLWIASHRGEHD